MNNRGINSARRALYIVLIIIVATLAGASFVSWPQAVTSRFALKGSGPAISLSSPGSGYVSRVLVRDGDWVEAEEPLIEYTGSNGISEVLAAQSSGFFIPDSQACSGIMMAEKQPLARIVESGPLIMQMGAGPGELGSLRPGMQVIAQLDAYPSQNYGNIEARVTWIALIPGGQAADGSPRYLVQAEITSVPNGLRQLLRPGLLGQAEIITGEERLINRLIP